ncbi:5-formyltetrahydrofolate cyclo-ligase [Evansella halocellulosilytica]|uniref:5-formyltetrahydrofolate cyclo-ligase n=1 Tax=Evansella halocellulosilytica TaxID=2011013 RepID=UPI000BB8EEA7|nr:5-formyltetrahydrofolate cyclo-ligase [Evansella halocellulosilytica]
MNKLQLRQRMKASFHQLSERERHTKTKKIHEQLYQWSGWHQADVIGTTISVGSEVNTYTLIEKCWQERKRVVVPKCEPNSKQLHFYHLTSFSQLEDSFYGLKEPNPDKCERIEPANIQLLIVPGLVFDKSGYRIGYGGGYYDRFLARNHLETCALCYEFQMVHEVPHEDHDIPVRTIITESDLISCTQ